MQGKEITSKSRRRFLGTLSGLMTGAMAFGPGDALAMKLRLKHLFNSIDAEAIIRSVPLQKKHVVCRNKNGRHFLMNRDRSIPVLRLNGTGRRIWKMCDGNNSPVDISRNIQKTFRVDHHQAYLDCLCFLAALKSNGLIHI